MGERPKPGYFLVLRGHFIFVHRVMPGNSNIHTRSFSLTVADVDLAVEHAGPFSYTQQFQQASLWTLACRDIPVVLDLEDQFVSFFPQVDRRLRGPGAADDAGERLLENAKQGRGPFGVQLRLLKSGLEITSNAGPSLEFLNLPLHGRFE